MEDEEDHDKLYRIAMTQKANQEIIRLTAANLVRVGDLVRAPESIHGTIAILSSVLDRLERAVDSLPNELHGRTVGEMRDALIVWKDSLCASLVERLETLGKL
jgi:hypothetical protein